MDRVPPPPGIGDAQSVEGEFVLEATGRPGLWQALRELFAYRATIVAFAERDVRVKYKQALLGVAWAIIQPLAFLGVFAIFFGRVARIDGGGVPYVAFAFSALIGWTYVATTVSFGANALLHDAALVRKVYFPREVPVIAAALAASVDLGTGLLAFLLLGSALGANISWTAMLTPLLLPLVAMPAIGLSLGLAALNAYYRDFRFALPLGIQLWMFASPVAYPLTKLPSEWRLPFAVLNPVAGPLDGFRHLLSLGTLPPFEFLAGSALGGAIWLFFGYRLFKRLEPNFADVI